ncbi:hypothetical protein Gpo141_00000579 [Globisporangium polare]
MAENEDAERAASDAEPEEESDLDAGLTSDSSPLKSSSSAASGSMHDRKRSSPFMMPYAGANGAAGVESEGVASASDYWKDGHAPDSIDVKLAAVRRYFRATRALYELQFQMKRPAAILRMKTNSYGFNKTNSTFDTLAALITPLRQRQVLDEWTALEIAIFEEAFEKFDRKFHLIADQLPNKSVKDVIALFYVWKRHGSCAKYTDFDDDDDDLPEPDMPAETKYMIQQLKRRQACTREYISAARCLFAPRSAPLFNHKRAKISDFGLQGVPNLKSAAHGTSLLRSISPLDSWTPIEIRVFEVAIECYGKDFHRVARVIGTKTCRETIALYYIWKKDPHYQTVKNRWGKNEIYQSRKDFVASAHHPAAASATES